VQGDGLTGMQHLGVDTVVIAGMSAESMLRMFEGAPGVLASVPQLVLQPNQNAERVRAWALHSGWHLRDEQMLEEHGRFFVVCAFARGTGADPAYLVPGWTQASLCRVGPRLLARKDAVAKLWFERQRLRLSRWVTRDARRLQPELDLWDAACEAMRPTNASNAATLVGKS
jgi:tRNA A22 N-methylase